MSQTVVILGASGHGKVVAETFRASGVSVLGFLDASKPKGTPWAQSEVLGGDDLLADLLTTHTDLVFFVALGDNGLRRRVTERILREVSQAKLATCVHPAAVVAADVLVEPGVAAFTGAVIQPGCQLHRGVLVNTGATLDHDCCMESYSSLAPGVTTGGNVHLEQGAVVSLGANIVHGVRVGAHALLGAGALVLDDVPSFAVAYGIPAKVVRQRSQDEPYL